MPPSPDFKAWTADLLTAAAFLTRLPLPAVRDEAARQPARAMRVYPVIGLLVGLIGTGVFALADGLALSPWLAGLLALAATVLLTGALHEDGLADVADGFGGGESRARKLAIMRDSRIGSYGVLALVFSLALRGGALAALGDPAAVLAALVAAHGLARALLPLAMILLPAARDDGLAAGFGRPRGRDAALALGLAVGLAWLALGLVAALVVTIAALTAAAAIGLLARRQIGGYTGDVLGTSEQAVECAVLLAAVALL
jgi:adenosylcobinamide-GDP ribazoletransferase